MYDSMRSLAYEMRLHGFHRSLEQRCEQALADNLHPSDIIRLLLEDERDARKSATAKRLAKRAKFRQECELEEWDQTFKRGVTKAKFKDLAMLNFYNKKQNLILVGKTGVGKTQLAISLGKRICDEGISVDFHSVNLLFEEVLAEKAAGRYLKLVRKMAKTGVLILDDFALRKYSHEEANTLLEIIEERSGKGICIITSQVNPEGWSSLFEDPVIAEAIVDRLINPSELLEFDGPSYRGHRGKS